MENNTNNSRVTISIQDNRNFKEALQSLQNTIKQLDLLKYNPNINSDDDKRRIAIAITDAQKLLAWMRDIQIGDSIPYDIGQEGNEKES